MILQSPFREGRFGRCRTRRRLEMIQKRVEVVVLDQKDFQIGVGIVMLIDSSRRLKPKRGFAAAMWNLDQAASEAACARYRSEKAPCEVIAPETFAMIASLVPDPPAPKQAAADQGSDGNKSKKKPASKKPKKN